MKAIVVLTMLALAGCASSSGVHSSGPDTFTITTTASPGAGGSAKAKSSAYAEAGHACAKTGSTVSVVSERVTAPSFNDGMHTLDLVFKCA